MKIVDKRRIKSAAKKLGLFVFGNFLIGTRNKDVISGFAIDGAPSSTYVWTFLLPAFDDLEFMHMSLGVRSINVNSLGRPLEDVLAETWKSISYIGHADKMIDYLDRDNIVGEYAEWTRFICLIRMGKFDQADEMLSSVERLGVASIPRKLAELKTSKSHGGWAAVQDLLVEWSSRTDQILTGVPSEI